MTTRWDRLKNSAQRNGVTEISDYEAWKSARNVEEDVLRFHVYIISALCILDKRTPMCDLIIVKIGEALDELIRNEFDLIFCQAAVLFDV